MFSYALGKKLSFIGIIGYALSCVASASVDMLLKIFDSHDATANLYLADFIFDISAAVFLLLAAVGYFVKCFRSRDKSMITFLSTIIVGVILMSVKAFMPLGDISSGLYGSFAYEYYVATVHCLYDSFIYSMAVYFSPLIVSAMMLVMSMRYSNTKKWLFVSLAAGAIPKALIAALASSGKIAFMESIPVFVAIIVIELLSVGLLSFAEYVCVPMEIFDDEHADDEHAADEQTEEDETDRAEQNIQV